MPGLVRAPAPGEPHRIPLPGRSIRRRTSSATRRRLTDERGETEDYNNDVNRSSRVPPGPRSLAIGHLRTQRPVHLDRPPRFDCPVVAFLVVPSHRPNVRVGRVCDEAVVRGEGQIRGEQPGGRSQRDPPSPALPLELGGHFSGLSAAEDPAETRSPVTPRRARAGQPEGVAHGGAGASPDSSHRGGRD